MFEYPHLLFLLLIVPFFVIIMIFNIVFYKKKVKTITQSISSDIIPYYTEGQKWVALVFYTLGIILAVLSLARPKWGVDKVDVSLKGRDVLILVDVSFSMATPDVFSSRLDLCKKDIDELLKNGSGDRYGLMVFSGVSDLLVPVTLDYGAVSFFNDSIYPGMLDKSGTNIYEALIDASESFLDKDFTNKLIVLFTDGENLNGDYDKMIKVLKDKNIKVLTIGVGSENGEPIPIKDNTGKIIEYVKDENGNYVMSKLDESKLKEIAAKTGGGYMKANGYSGELIDFISKYGNVGTKNNLSSISFSRKKDRFYIFLIPALILFTLAFILDQGKILLRRRKLFSQLNGTFVALFLMLFGVINIHCGENKILNDKNGAFWGNNDFKKGKYKDALKNYSKASDAFKENEKGKLFYNIGNTFYKQEDYDNSLNYYKESENFIKDKSIKAKLYYNRGLMHFKKEQYEDACKYFKESLKLDGTNEDARYNYAVCELLNSKKDDKKDKQDNKSKADNQLLKALMEQEKQLKNEESKEKGNGNRYEGKYW